MPMTGLESHIRGRFALPTCGGGWHSSAWIALLWLAAGLAAADSATPSLTLRIVSEPVAAGGWAQIKIYAPTPQQIAAGSLAMDLDPSFFGDISNVAVFSATGDAAGYAHVSGKHVDAHFTSPSGGIGQLPGLPLFAISVPVLPGLRKGAAVTLALDVSNSALSDTLGNSYAVIAAPAIVQVGGSMSVQSVAPAGGVVPPGSVVQIHGTGFDSSTAVAIDGVGIASAQLVSSQQINLTLGGATEMTGKRLRVTNSAGEQIDYFPALPSTPSDNPSSFVQPLVPLATYALVEWAFPFNHPSILQYFALQNQTSAPVTVTFFNVNDALTTLETLTIPAGEVLFPNLDDVIIGQRTYYPSFYYGSSASLYMIASAPIRMLAYKYGYARCFNCTADESTFPPTAMVSLPPSPQNFFLSPGPFVWNWQAGQPPPAPIQVGFYNMGPGVSFSATVSSSARQWLNVTPAQGDTSETLMLTPNVGSLSPGTYMGSVTLTQTNPLPPYLSGFAAPASTIQVTLNVSASPFLDVSAASGTGFSVRAGTSTPVAKTITVQSISGLTTSFTTMVTTDSGGNWLAVSPASGTTPTSLTVTANPAGLANGIYAGQLKVQGAANTLAVPVTLYVTDPAIGRPLSFVLATGTSTNTTGTSQGAAFEKGSVSGFTVQTQSGGNWLSVIRDTSSAQVDQIQVNASAVGLAPGSYQGSITVTLTNGTVTIPVTLAVLGPPSAPLTVTPPSLSLTAPAGQTVTQALVVHSSSGPALFRWRPTAFVWGAAPNGVGYVYGTLINGAIDTRGIIPVAPATLQVQASASQPGTYYASIVFTWDGGTLTVPVTLFVTATQASPPLLAAVVNAASQTPAAIAPGEIIGLFGQGIGPAPAGFTLDSAKKLLTDINGTQVLINGKPAPLLYASTSQVNAIVPYEVGTSGVATVQVISAGVPSASWEVPLAASAPGLFTIGSSGMGQAAVLNQDNTVNGVSNPAAPGTVIQIFGTGAGQTEPASITGSLSGAGNITALPVTVNIGGIDAPVTYHGSAPGAIAGLLQVNAVVPPGITPSPAVPILTTVGGSRSQDGVTIVVK